jgi:hypothetical protein
VVFSFARGSQVAELGLINGYAKVDPKTRAHRYPEYRRIRKVTWTFPNGDSFTEDLKDNVEAVQRLRIPVQAADQVTMTIGKSTRPGSSLKSRDAILVSEATMAAPQS